MSGRQRSAGTTSPDRAAGLARVHRNFWLLVTATILAVGVLSLEIKAPAGTGTAVLTAVSALAALVSISLAGRILVVTTGQRRRRRRG